MEKGWLVLNPTTLLWTKNNSGILYDTLRGCSFIFKCNGQIKKWCEELNNPDNLYCISFIANNEEEEIWIKNINTKNLGQTVEITDLSNKPVSLPPLFFMGDTHEESKEYLFYLYDLVFYIGGNEVSHRDYYKQINYPIHSDSRISLQEIKQLLNNVEGYNLQNITIIGTEILSDEEFQKWWDFWSKKNYRTEFLIKAEDLDRLLLSELCFSEKVFIRVLCHSPEEYKISINRVKNKDVNIKFGFVITSEKNYQQFENILENTSDSISLLPVFTGENVSFFKEYIFSDREDILEEVLSKREIFMHQVINSNFFGKLFIMPDKKIYSNLNFSSLGIINDSIYEIIKIAMQPEQAWKRIRAKKPCSDCLMQWLCPSPSNYELIMEKENLCFYDGF